MPLPETSASLAITLFGPMAARVHGSPLPRFRSRKALWLLALLTLRQDRPVAREWLAGTLWPDVDQSAAFANLRPVISELRRALKSEGKRLQAPDRLTLRLDATGADIDVIEFDAALRSGTLSDLERAVALYHGPLLEGCLEEWVFQERSEREQNCLQALLKLGNAALTAGDYETAVGHFQRAAGLDAWSDAARRGWMEALAKQGNRNAALQVYREFQTILRSDPNAVPDEQTRALYERLRAEARRQARVSPGTAAEPAVPRIAGYLPHSLTTLVGREDERQEVAERLRRSRLVTLTGPGGIGKTRLAVAVAAESVHDYADGVWLVALESLLDAAGIARQIASVMGLKEEPDRSLLQSLTEHLRSKRLLLALDNCEHLLGASAQITAHLLQECPKVRVLATSREALGIVGETVWSVPSLATPDLEHLPQGRATLLRVLMGYESVQLFMERAQSVQQTFALTSGNARSVAHICARLEGIPLAIELAAARVRILTVEQIALRLDDHLNLLTAGHRAAQSRQQTLRASLDWSYALLSESERHLLRRLSVFAGGWTLEAAEAACAGNAIESGQVLDLLTSLLDKSLVLFTDQEREAGGRYRLLEMVRQYGTEKLALSGEADQVKARHRDYFLALAEQAEPQLTGVNQGAWLARLEADHANLRAALGWCQAEKDGGFAELQMAGALYKFWEMHGHYSEGRAYLAKALAREAAGKRTKERGRALNGAGMLAYYQGDYEEARTRYTESLAIFRELDNRQGAGWSLNGLGDVAGAQGDYQQARLLYEESLEIFREQGNRHGAASLLHHLGRIVRDQGDYEQARAFYEESLAIARELGNRENIAWSLHHRGNVASAQGDYQTARSLQEEGLAIFRELGNRQGAAWTLSDLGDIAGAQGDHDAIQAFYEESLAIFRELDNRHGTASLLHRIGRIVREQGDYGQARILHEESLAIFRELGNRQGEGGSLNALGRDAFEQERFASARTLYAEGIHILKELGDRRGVAEGLEGLAAVMLAQAEARKAVQLLGAAQSLREQIGARRLPTEQGPYERQMGQARRALDAAMFAACWKAGSALTWEQAAALALLVEEPNPSAEMEPRASVTTRAGRA